MRNEFDDLENLDISKEDAEFFKAFFEAQSSKITLPESLKSENLSKKYAREIEEIENEEKSQNLEGKESKSQGKVIPLFKKRGLAAIAACVAFAGIIYAASGLSGGDILFDQACEEEAPEAAEAPAQMEAARDNVLTAEAPNTALYSAKEGTNRDNLAEGGIEMDKSADLKAETGSNSLLTAPPPANDIIFEMNPSTGAEDMDDAGKFFIFNGADKYVNSDTLEVLIVEERDHSHHVNKSNALYNGFLERLY